MSRLLIALSLVVLMCGCVTSRTVCVKLPANSPLPQGTYQDFEIYLGTTMEVQVAFKIVDEVASRHGLRLESSREYKLDHGSGLVRFYSKTSKGKWLMYETTSYFLCKIYVRPKANRLEVVLEDDSPRDDFWQMNDELRKRLQERFGKYSHDGA